MICMYKCVYVSYTFYQFVFVLFVLCMYICIYFEVYIYMYINKYQSIYLYVFHLHIHIYISHISIFHILDIRLLHLRVKKIIVWYRRVIEKRKRIKLLITFKTSRGAKVIQRQFRKYIESQKNAAVDIQRIIRGWLKRNFIESFKRKVCTYF